MSLTATPTTPVTTAPTVDITEKDLVKLLNEKHAKGTCIVSFGATTDARLKKTGNPFAMPVTKTSRVNGVVGYDYENAVNRQREREAAEGIEAQPFVGQPRQWGERLDRIFVLHKGQLYITVKVERSLGEPVYHDAKGVEIDPEAVKPFIPKRSKPATQGTEKEVIARDYKLTSFDSIKVNGVDHRIMHGV